MLKSSQRQRSSHTTTRHRTPSLHTASTRCSTTAQPLYKKKTGKKVVKTLTPSTDVENHTPISRSPHGVLVRDFIRESLYSKQGYFNASRVINSPGVINFSQLLGKAAYEKRLDELYFSGVQGWTTPVEIFQPFYAQSLARFFVSHLISSVNFQSRLDLKQISTQLKGRVDLSALKGIDYIHTLHGLTPEEDLSFRQFGVPLKQPDKSAPIHGLTPNIIEIGAGNGTCASNILDYLATFYPNVYAKTSYNILEMSESLSWQQRELLDASHSGKYTVHTMNAAEMVEMDSLKQQQGKKNHTFIFGLEVLDNMVHDKVIKGQDGKWYQVMVAEKAIISQLQDEQNTNPQNVYTFRIHDHPAQIPPNPSQQPTPQASQPPLQTPLAPHSTSSTSNISTPDQLAQSPPSHNFHKVPSQELLSYLTKQPFPVDYTKLNTKPDSQFLEYVMPIYDPIIEECTELYNHFLQSPHIARSPQQQKPKKGFFNWLTRRVLDKNLSTVDDVVYLPTESLRFLHRINKLYPSHTLLLADFDVLPTTEPIRSKNGPVVAHKETDSKLRGKTRDEPSYLVDLGLCDIFFPTDFEFLKHMYTQVVLNQPQSTPSSPIRDHLSPLSANFATDQSLHDDQVRDLMTKPTQFTNTSLALSQDKFLSSYAHTAATECKNGFNPMLTDFYNMAIFIGQRKGPL